MLYTALTPPPTMSSRKSLGPVGTLILSGLFLLIGLGMAGFGTKQWLTARASTSWPTAEGKVLSSQVVKKRGSKGRTNYSADVMYEFTVDGTRRMHNDVSFGDYSSNSPSHAQEVVARYPVGKQVTVYYSADDSVLEPGSSWAVLMLPGIGAVFLLVGGLMGLSLLRRVL
jgi:hypothetical protein